MTADKATNSVHNARNLLLAVAKQKSGGDLSATDQADISPALTDILHLVVLLRGNLDRWRSEDIDFLAHAQAI